MSSGQKIALQMINEEFYRAFENLDIERMKSIWQRSGQTRCIHPGWQPLVGYQDIIDSWERIFNATQYMEIELENAQYVVDDTLGVVSAVEVLVSAAGGRTVKSKVQVTNIYQRIGHQWKLSIHHASP